MNLYNISKFLINVMKKIIILSVISLATLFIPTNIGQTKLKSYYYGDAINYNGELYVTTTNTDSLEVFKLENNELKQIAKIRPFDPKYLTYSDFYDSKFDIENNQLYIYAVSGPTLYKYELVGDSRLSLVFSQKNTYWEWYNRVDKFGDNIVTISPKGVKIWNSNLEVIDGYDNLANSNNPYNIRSYGDRYVLNVSGNSLKIYDREKRSELRSIAVNYKDAVTNHKASQDEDGNLYVIDDYFLKKFDFSGNLLYSFKHLDYPGYDTSLSEDGRYVYISNGAGIVKLNKLNLKEVTYRYTWSNGGWAMGLKAVDADGDKLVVFNNKEILILDSNLSKIASYEASEEAKDTTRENLFLNLNHYTGGSGAKIIASGGGFMPDEKLTIKFGDKITEAQADHRGRFEETIIVPEFISERIDVKVDGLDSKLTYSTSFKVLK